MFRNFDFTSFLFSMAYNLPAILICLTVHEFSHGFVAYKLGDVTAKQAGRLSLNPLRHIDPIGFLCLIFFRFGWAKPVPVSFGYLKNPKRDMAIIAAAGPVSNFLLGFIFLLISAFILAFAPNGTFFNVLLTFCLITAVISVGLGVFNLIPVPPLDGSRIITPFLPSKAQGFFIRNGEMIQVLILIALFLGYLSVPARIGSFLSAETTGISTDLGISPFWH